MLRRMIEDEIAKAVEEIFSIDSVNFKVEIPPERFGEFSSNVAMVLTRKLRMNPREIAEKLKERLRESEIFEDVRIDGPGFLNFDLRNEIYLESLRRIIKNPKSFGRRERKKMKVQIEFVSANPTGPLTVGHGRQAIIGDVLSNVFDELGYDVVREYYFNDAGRQMDLLARSLWVRYNELFGRNYEIPEDGYHGSYLIEMARKLKEDVGDRFVDRWDEDVLEFFKERAKNEMFEMIKKTLEKLGVKFDVYFNEKTLIEDGTVEEVLNILESKGMIYEKDGAIWLKVSELIDENDKVLVRSNGTPTYFLTDIAYHYNKFKRGFEKVYDIWGSDHHGHVPRMKAAMKALGFPDDFLNIIIHQFVTLKRGGREVKMSTRSGEFVTLDELVNTVGVDPTRYFFAMIDPNTHMVFDMDLAVSRSMDNPVYYVQYAHARIRSLFEKAKEKGIDYRELEDLEELSLKDEKLIMRDMDIFEEILEDVVKDSAPNRLTTYVENLVSRFHAYYTDNLILDVESPKLSNARLNLCRGMEIVLKRTFSILGITAPERM
ncbi:MAG TPA: arginine--tRNA ligase [Thermotogales bacterium]|nr:arginine--tRNA ligase [Thermotogales bacterium]